MKDIVFWGGTGHAKVLRECMAHLGFRLIALFDNDISVSSPFEGVPLYHRESGFEAWYVEQGPNRAHQLVTIGGDRGFDRVGLHQFLSDHGLLSTVAIHPTSFVAPDVVVGDGSQILANATVAVQTVLGISSIVNTSASIDHECWIGDGVHIAPGATLAGLIKVGDYSMIGAGAIVLPRVVIGSNVVVGAGSVVTSDLPDNCVAYGCPARIKKWRQPPEGLGPGDREQEH